MNQAVAERRECHSVRAVSQALVPDARIHHLRLRTEHSHLLERITALLIAVDDAIAALVAAPSRSRAWLLVLAADCCWQVLRALGDRSGDDQGWIEAALPADWASSDTEIADTHFSRQVEIIRDAKWLFDLHSALRHPGSALGGAIWLMRDPPPEQERERLERAAGGVRAVLLNVASRLQ